MSKRKKILFISYAAYPLFNEDIKFAHGGAELDLFNLATALDKEKFDVDFIVADFNQPKQERRNNISLYKATKITTANPFYGLINFIKLTFLIKKINPDIIFSEAAGWLTVELIIIKTLLRKKFIFRSAHIRNINGYLDTKPYGKLFRKLINNIDFFILQNEGDNKILKENYPYTKEALCIRNLQAIPPKNCLSYSERNTILWVGRSEKIKRPELFLSLVKNMPEKKFLMIMPNTNSEIFDSILESKRKLPNLEIIAGVSGSKVISFFQKARYFISTSDGEGFPNVILEAMKTGVPVISYFLDYDKIIETNNCGLVAQGKIDEVIKFIRTTPENEWHKISDNCYNFAKSNFDIDKGIKEYEKLFLQL